MNKVLLTLSCVIGLSLNFAQAKTQYTEQQLAKIIQEDLTQLQKQPKSKQIQGERVDFELPSSMHLAFMVGNPKDRFMAEYINKNEKIETWKTNFTAQQRSKIPFDVLAYLTITGIQEACPSPYLYSNVSSPKNDTSRIVFSYFCKLPQAAAPLGEGGIMTFLQGKEYSFKFWNSWRPQSSADFKEFTIVDAETAKSQSVNVGLDPLKYHKFFGLAHTVGLCNPQAKQPCKAKP